MKHKKNRKAAAKKVGLQNKTAILIVKIIGVVVLIFLGIIMCLPEDSLTFNFAENPGMWQVSAGSKSEQVGDMVQLTKGGRESYIVVPQINLDADYYDVCVIEGDWPIAYDQGHLLFISPFNETFDYNFRYDFDTGSAGKRNRRYINLNYHGAWQGMIKAILLLPATDAKQVSLKGIRFIHSNPWTKIKAWLSDFTRYSDPLLGTCFAMATPIFMGKPFNPFFVPVLWGFLAVYGIIAVGVYLFKADRKISKIAAGVVLIVIMLAWGLLDLRNNVYYLKAISRNISLYWGKPIDVRRGIVVGDPEFINFIKFCDEQIPLQAKVISQIPDELPGTPASYLSRVQYGPNLRPRFAEGKAKTYYIFYRSQKPVGRVFQEQTSVDEQLKVEAGQSLFQEIRLWRPAKYLDQMHLWLDQGRSVEVMLLSEDKKNIIGTADYIGQNGKEAVFRFILRSNKHKGGLMVLQIRNTGKVPMEVGAGYGDQYPEGCLSQAGKKLFCDLAFRLNYKPDDLKLFKSFSADAYILIDEARQ